MRFLIAAAPAVPDGTAGRSVAAVFLVFLAILLIYFAIMGTKLRRLERDLGDITELLDERERGAAEQAAAQPEQVSAETASR